MSSILLHVPLLWVGFVRLFLWADEVIITSLSLALPMLSEVIISSLSLALPMLSEVIIISLRLALPMTILIIMIIK